MCGICGVLGINDEGLVKNMCDVILYRGPDDDGYYFDGDFGMGMRRLAIIGRSTGHQPMHNEDMSVWVVFNGEIYNYRDIKADLECKGHKFYTVSDTEVIPHLYEEYGDAFATHLRGMFAISLWDAGKRRLIIARDRLGIKPLYYTVVDNIFMYASEAKQFLQYEGFKPEMNVNAVNRMFTYRTIPGTGTMFKGVKKLLPGHMLIHENGSFTIKKYWDIPVNEARAASIDAYAAGLRELLEESVRIRLMSEVPLGAYLSGGLDSSAIVALMSQHSQEPVKTFTVGYGESTDEFEYARMVADHCKAEYNEIRISMDRMTDFIPRVLWHAEVPLSDPASIPFYVTSEKLKQHVTVALLGEGSDELFAGYSEYRILSPKYKVIPDALRKEIFKFKRIPLNESEKRGVFTANLSGDISPLKEIDSCLSGRDDGRDLLYRILRYDVKQVLPNHQLLRVDKISMAHSIEARVPFLDHKVVEYSMSLPSQVKLNGTNGKYVLKKAIEDLLPSRIIHRQKKGFNIPIDIWMEKDLKEVISNVLESPRTMERGYFKPENITRMVKKPWISKGKANYAIWLAFMVEVWNRVFIDGGNYKSPCLDMSKII